MKRSIQTFWLLIIHMQIFSITFLVSFYCLLLWVSGVLLLWNIVTVGYCYCGLFLLWNIFTVEYCYCAVLLLWSILTVEYRYCGVLLLWSIVTVDYCYCIVFLLKPSGFLLQFADAEPHAFLFWPFPSYCGNITPSA
jgi:hypothetical protein